MGRLDGKVAFVTGGARGQGRSHCIRLAQEGADIVTIDICDDIPSNPYPLSRPSDLEETVKAVEALDRRILAFQGDVRDQASLDDAVARGFAEFGRLDIVSANAGICAFGWSWEIEREAWDDVNAVNLTGVWQTAKATVPKMLEAGNGGSIILTSSAGGLRPYLQNSHYIAAKHGVVGLMRSLALELAPHHIRVNSIHPTCVNTAMIMNDYCWKLFVPDAENPTIEQFAAASQTTNALPIPWVEPVDISNAVLFLASDEARYITGVTLPVDAGNLLK